jgi:hypothetical protein
MQFMNQIMVSYYDVLTENILKLRSSVNIRSITGEQQVLTVLDSLTVSNRHCSQTWQENKTFPP